MAKYRIPVEYDSSNTDPEDACVETLSGNRLKITLEHPHREIIVGAGKLVFGLLGKPKITFDLNALFAPGEGS